MPEEWRLEHVAGQPRIFAKEDLVPARPPTLSIFENVPAARPTSAGLSRHRLHVGK